MENKNTVAPGSREWAEQEIQRAIQNGDAAYAAATREYIARLDIEVALRRSRESGMRAQREARNARREAEARLEPGDLDRKTYDALVSAGISIPQRRKLEPWEDPDHPDNS